VGRERICALEAQKLAQVNDWLAPFRELWETRFNQLDELLDDLGSQTDSKM
jgi:hypothetical protein